MRFSEVFRVFRLWLGCLMFFGWLAACCAVWVATVVLTVAADCTALPTARERFCGEIWLRVFGAGVVSLPVPSTALALAATAMPPKTPGERGRLRATLQHSCYAIATSCGAASLLFVADLGVGDGAGEFFLFLLVGAGLLVWSGRRLGR